MDRQRVYWCTALSIIIRVSKLCDFIGLYFKRFHIHSPKMMHRSSRKASVYHLIWLSSFILSLSIKHLSSDFYVYYIYFIETMGFYLRESLPLKVKSIVFARFKFWKQIWNQNEIINRTVFFKIKKIKHF